MLKKQLKQMKTAVIVVCLCTLLLGGIYPAIVTLVGQLFFSCQAQGSLLEHHGVLVGSRWIGQEFTELGFFWGRPSATTPFAYNARYSSASNDPFVSSALLATLKKRVAYLNQFHSSHNRLLPVDLVTSSASGLDPDITPRAAYYQVSRIAKARGISKQRIEQLIKQMTERRLLGIIGEPRVNVLQLNLALDDLK